jgi:hypothetical protein
VEEGNLMHEAAVILYKAADEIDKGWCKCLEDAAGNVCAMGAMYRAGLGDAKEYYPFELSPRDPKRVTLELAEEVLTRVMQAHFHTDQDIRLINDLLAASGREISMCMRKAADQIMGDIGDNPRRIEVIPATKPVRQPMPEPAPTPAPAKEPEKVPA